MNFWREYSKFSSKINFLPQCAAVPVKRHVLQLDEKLKFLVRNKADFKAKIRILS